MENKIDYRDWCRDCYKLGATRFTSIPKWGQTQVIAVTVENQIVGRFTITDITNRTILGLAVILK